MRRYTILTMMLCLLLGFYVPLKAAGIFKWVKVGRIQVRVIDNGHQSETEAKTGNSEGVARYDYDGNRNTNRLFTQWGFRNNGTHLAVRNWKRADGTAFPYMTAGAEYGTSDSEEIQFVLEEPDGRTHHNYRRYQPPQVVVDGMVNTDPFPFDEADEVAPDKINKYSTTADQMFVSRARTWIGVEVTQKVFAWSQKNHDDYVIYDMVFKNTGNVDRDADIELPTQTLDSLYVMRMIGAEPDNSMAKEWSSWYGCRPGEDLRIMYYYPHRSKGSTVDDFGDPREDQNMKRLAGPQFAGEATLFMSNKPNDFTNDNMMQPQMHTIWSYRELYVKEHAKLHMNELWKAFEVHKRGFTTAIDAKFSAKKYMTGTYPGTFHELPHDEQGYKHVNDDPGFGGHWHEAIFASYGPFKLAPGDSIRLVYAMGFGSISKRKGFEVASAWYAKNCTYAGADNLPPQYAKYPELAETENDKAKDRWIMTGKDSLFANLRAAQWNQKQNFNIPIPPPAPSVEVQSRADAIRVKWDAIAESASDFAGYRVYRAVGSYADSAWVKVFECTKSNLVHQFDDNTASRGASYYYYVTSYDDGSQNAADWNGKKESLESGMYLNMTTRPASLQKAPGTSLDQIRVVPNPFSLAAAKIQYPGDTNMIQFLNVPGECTIRIFSESGDLVKTLKHDKGTGDVKWGVLGNEQQTSDTGQRPVSGIYIANITTPDGQSKNVKFVIVR
jgi:hypothetical protein